MSEIVFILGAGCSKEAGAPLMLDFLDRAEDLLHSEQPGPWLEDFERVFSALVRLRSAHSKSKLDTLNLESVFGAFEMQRLLGVLPDAEAEALEKSMKVVITQTLERTMLLRLGKDRFGKSQWQPAEEYKRLARLLAGEAPYGKPLPASVITFNYDVGLDHALNYIGAPALYHLPKQEPKRGISVLKLHGSLNWGWCEKCKAVIPWELAAFPLPLAMDFNDDDSIPLDIGTKLASGTFTHCGDAPVRPEPVIIPPTWNKTQYHSQLSDVWRQAARELSEAKRIFVCGYSLPETDSFFRYLFALGSVGPSRIREFRVFDPDPKVEKRFRSILGPETEERFQFESQGFGFMLGVAERTLKNG